MRNEKGFSLIELMIVVAIIGILAAIAVPNFQKYQAKSRQGEAKSLLSGIYTANKSFFAEWTIYRGDFGNIGFAPEGDLRYNAGFASAGLVAVPGNYTGPAASGEFRTQQACGGLGAGAGDCEMVHFLAANPTTEADRAVFTAEAFGDVDGDTADEDQWTIDQAKAIRNTVNDLD